MIREAKNKMFSEAEEKGKHGDGRKKPKKKPKKTPKNKPRG